MFCDLSGNTVRLQASGFQTRQIDNIWHSYWTFVNSKCLIWIFQFWIFSLIFVVSKVTCLVTVFDRELQVFKNSPKSTFFCIFNSLLSTQNVNLARFASNVEWAFSVIFKHCVPWSFQSICFYPYHRICKEEVKLFLELPLKHFQFDQTTEITKETWAILGFLCI